MVFGRRGAGGPQIAEVKRMLAEEGAGAAAGRAWLVDRGEALARAEGAPARAFAALGGT